MSSRERRTQITINAGYSLHSLGFAPLSSTDQTRDRTTCDFYFECHCERNDVAPSCTAVESPSVPPWCRISVAHLPLSFE